MLDTSTGDPGKPMEQPNNDLSEVMGQLSVTTDNSRENPPSLSDMPVDVVMMIIDSSDYKGQLLLRKTSKSLREIVDKQKPDCKSIQVNCYPHESTIRFDDYFVVYKDEHKLDNYNRNEIYVIGNDYERIALDDLASNLKNPKLQLEEFSVNFCDYYEERPNLDEYYEKLLCILKSLNHQLSVGRVEFKLSTLSCLPSILQRLQPGILKRISLDTYLSSKTDVDLSIYSTEMNQVSLLDQWKQAEELELKYCFDTFPMEHARHFKRFKIHEHFLQEDKFIRIKDYFSKLQNFEQCTLLVLELFFHSEAGYELLGAPVTSNTMEEVFHHPIPDSDYNFVFTKPIESHEIKIEKKKRD